MSGHRGWRTTNAAISGHFYWDHMSNDIEQFVKSCIHCLSTAPGKVVPRPLAHALHAAKPNELLHFDFCYIMPGEMKFEALLKWFASFGTVQNWVSDRGSHFKNEFMRLLNEAMKGFHYFTLAYCPLSNGTVEVVCRELLRTLRALISELQLPQRCWPSLMPLVQSALNNAVLPRLGNRCPLTVFTGHPQDSPLRAITVRRDDILQVHSIEEARAQQMIQTEKLLSAMEQMHKDVTVCSSKKRQAAVDAHSRKTHVRPVDFSEGDYVLRGVLQRQRGKKEEAHARRLKLFRNKDYKVTEELRNHLAYQQDELFLIEKFDDIRKHNGVHQIL
eukprot:IDg6432t1